MIHLDLSRKLYLNIWVGATRQFGMLIHLQYTTKLRYLGALGDPLTLKVGGDWMPPFQLGSSYMDSWHLGPKFPFWLRLQKNLSYLGLSNTSIQGVIPSSIDSLELKTLDASHNQMHGSIQKISNIGSHGILRKISTSVTTV